MEKRAYSKGHGMAQVIPCPCIARHSSTVLWYPPRSTHQTYFCKCLSLVMNWDNASSTCDEQYIPGVEIWTQQKDNNDTVPTKIYNCLSLSTSPLTTLPTPFNESAAPSGCNIWWSQQQDSVACLFKGQGCNHVPTAKQVPTKTPGCKNWDVTIRECYGLMFIQLSM